MACFAAVLAIGAPAGLGLGTGVAFALLVAGFGVALLFAFSRPGRLAAAVACALTLTVFALPLAASWRSGASGESSIGGLLPYSDALGHYYCARILVEGHTFRSAPSGAWCSRRPLFAAALAGLLALARQDLRQVLGVLVLLTAVSCFLAARELRASHGAAAAALFLVTLFLFYRRFAGTTLTEHLGLSLGAIGFAVLWRGTRRAEFRLFLFGVFLLSVALNARAGALLVLPAVALWGSRWFPGSPRFSWRRLALACAVIVVGFALNAVFVRTIGIPGGMFSNFSYTLYGLVFGGDWMLALTHHPSLAALDEPEQARRVLGLALDGIRTDPMLLVRGCVRAWRTFLGTRFPFIYVGFKTLSVVLLALTAAGLALCLRRRKDRFCSLLLATALGVVLSVPFAPPWDADAMRVYAATMPLTVAVAALGLAWLVGRLAPRASTASPGDAEVPSVALSTFAAGLVALGVVPAFALMLLREAPRFPEVAASDCNDSMYVRMPAGSMISVVRDDEATPRYPLELREREFRAGLEGFRALNAGLTGELASVEAPFIIFNPLRLQPLGYAYVVARTALVPDRRSGAPFWQICAEPARDPVARAYVLVYATSIRPAWPLRAVQAKSP